MPQSSCHGIPLRVANRAMAVDNGFVSALLEEAASQLHKYKAWSSTFIATLNAARLSSREDLGGDFVWQDDFVEYWEPFTSIQRELLAIYDNLSDLDAPLAALVEPYIDPPTKAQIEFAIEDPVFLARPAFNRNQIAYETRRLRVWHQNFTHWLGAALKGIREVRTRA